VSIETQEDVDGLAAVGQVVATTLAAMQERVRPGVTTGELDAVAGAVFSRHGAVSAPRLTYGFPGETCISIDDEAVHGIPGARALRVGQLVTLDVTAELEGYVADAAVTVPVGAPSPRAAALLEAARAALECGIEAARIGRPVRAIGRAVEAEAERRGFTVLRELTGHGVGRAIHEPPAVPNWDDPAATEPLTPGLVLTIEPILADGEHRVVSTGDGWTVATAAGSLSAHFEHTVVITPAGARILTAAA
jgi:methionyl aminopeptidase